MDGFVSIESPLTTLTQNCKKFEWSEVCEKFFQLSKDTLTSSLILTVSEGTKGFIVYFDAFRVGLVFVLMILIYRGLTV